MTRQIVTDEDQVARALDQAFAAGSLSVIEAIDKVSRNSRETLEEMNGAAAMDLLSGALSVIIGDTLGAWTERARRMTAANDRETVQ